MVESTLRQVEPVSPSKQESPIKVVRSIRLNWEAILLSLPAFMLIVTLFAYPLLYGINLSLQSNDTNDKSGSLTLANYATIFSDPTQIESIWQTFEVAVPVTLFSILISIPLAYYMRRGIRFERPI